MKAPNFITREIWSQTTNLPSRKYVCGYCGERVHSNSGYQTAITQDSPHFLYICPNCSGPTFVQRGGSSYPGEVPGSAVKGLPAELESLYNEARQSASAGAHTAAVLVCRKMLMNIAVAEGAAENQSFVTYVSYLADKGYVPPKGRNWVDYIRQRGNEANHEIALMNETDATSLIHFMEMLLRFIYEMPSLVPPLAPKS
jgi:hypothetical protein